MRAPSVASVQAEAAGGLGGRCKPPLPPSGGPGAKPRENFQKTGCLVSAISLLLFKINN